MMNNKKNKFYEIVNSIKPVDGIYKKRAKEHLDSLTKPEGSLGFLEEIATSLAAIYKKTQHLEIGKKAVFVFACDHGVVAEGVSRFPSEVTRQMVFNFLNGGAGINVLARHAGADVFVVDIGVNYEFDNIGGLINKKVFYATKNITKEQAMSKEETLSCLYCGIDLANQYANKGYTLFATGDMGIGNTTPSAAITALLTKTSVFDSTGRGTGIDDKAFCKKVALIIDAIELNKPVVDDPFDVLMKVGGGEIAAIAGLCIGGAINGIPVLVDGFISSAGALVAWALNPAIKDYLLFSHKSNETGHKAILECIGVRPILDLGLRLGEGTGAALAMPIIDAAIKVYNDMATFEGAGVSKSET
ncbi:MAG: nicotinate-nucleotide--dimethylbenzimidazole phosphoribosyltransferase [Candidatus Magnetoovum sp. WYHC-5]|nr:nicotinate-nucleotide--dimethylbenzimidazole phosphoribosyltransferase [Candidatus Magnetoovum sp. WYHC-5]